MKKILSIVLILLFVCSISAQSYKITKLWESEKNLNTVESVLFDPAGKNIFTACIDGRPADIDSNGYISKFSEKGELIKLKWCTGLNGPKGSCIFDGKIYVTDINRLVVVDLKTGAILKSYPVIDASFLNDCTCDEEGRIYFSDTSEQNSVVYKLENGEVHRWLEGIEISGPNGLFYQDKKLYIGNTGSKELKCYDFESGKIKTIANVGMGIDGLKMLKDGSFLISNWSDRVSLLSTDGKVTDLVNTADQKMNAADFEFIPENMQIIVPTFFDNRIVCYQLEKK